MIALLELTYRYVDRDVRELLSEPVVLGSACQSILIQRSF